MIGRRSIPCNSVLSLLLSKASPSSTTTASVTSSPQPWPPSSIAALSSPWEHPGPGPVGLSVDLSVAFLMHRSCFATNVERALQIYDRSSLMRVLRAALSERDAEGAWRALQKLKKIGELPDPTEINASLTLLAYASHEEGLKRAQNLLSRAASSASVLPSLDPDSLSLLALSFARSGMFHISANTLRLLLKQDLFPPLKVWTSILEFFSKNPSATPLGSKVFLEICRYINRKNGEKRSGHEDSNSTSSSSKNEDRLKAMVPNINAFNMILKGCALVGDSVSAQEILQKMPLYGVSLDHESFTSLIKIYQKEGDLIKLGKILHRMKEVGLTPNFLTMDTLLVAYISLGEVGYAADLILSWARGRKDLETQMIVNTTSGTGVKPGGKPAKASEVELLLGWGSELEGPNSDIFVRVLIAYLDSSEPGKAAEFLISLDSISGSEGDSISTSAIEALLKRGHTEGARRVMDEMGKRNVLASCSSYSSLVKAYCKLPHPKKAADTLQKAAKAGYQLNMSCYEALMRAHILLQEYEDAYQLFKRVKSLGLEPLEPAFTYLLHAFRDTGNLAFVRRVLQASSREPPLKVVEFKHWNELIKDFCDSKRVCDASLTLKRMKEYGFEPDASTYQHMLSGYYTHGAKKTNEIMSIWPEISRKAASGEAEASEVGEELLNDFLFVFVRHGAFYRALEVVAILEARNFSVNKEKYWKLCLKYHKSLFTWSSTDSSASKPSSKRAKQHLEMAQAFKSWLHSSVNAVPGSSIYNIMKSSSHGGISS